ncbi:MAG: FAD-dependent oxidoreductase, partial [Phototrophicales bacterium]
RMFDFVFQMFSHGHAAVPALGMEEIPKQLASQLPEESIITNERVVSIHENKAKTASGEEFEAKAILIATEPNELSNAYRADLHDEHPRSTTCLYFAMDTSIFSKPMLALNALTDRLVNHFAVMSDVSYDYAPIDKSLLSVSIIGIPMHSETELIDAVRREMSYWYGTHAYEWEFLKRYDI